MKRTVIAGIVLVIIGMGSWFALSPVDWQNWLGFSKAAYFTLGQNYAFLSGLGPCLITALGLSTIVAGLWHAHNCHYDSCWRIGRHKVNGTPWCNVHHAGARPEIGTEELLSTLITEIRGLREDLARR
jgi:hypothetical protein